MNKNENNELLNEEELEKKSGGMKLDITTKVNEMHCLKAYGGPGYFNKITVKYGGPGYFHKNSSKCQEPFDENNKADNITNLE